LETPDFLVIGAGVAGLRGAIELSQAGSVLVVAKDSLRESSSEYAQGGIAVALGDDDEVRLHEHDTIAAGAGLCDPAAAWDLCGIVRNGEGLKAACDTLGAQVSKPVSNPILAMYELRNIHTVALLIARCALAREESRGAHFRTDFPNSRAEFKKHSLVSRGNEVIYR
jgi:aspartate oxidase